jgi:hypothetical protein
MTMLYANGAIIFGYFRFIFLRGVMFGRLMIGFVRVRNNNDLPCNKG